MMDSSDALAELLTLTLEVDEFGTRIYRNSVGLLHRIHGPALECANGAKYWYLNDRLHRQYGPAIEHSSGDKEWFLDGEQLTEREFHDRLK